MIPNGGGLFPAVVNQPSQLITQILTVHDHIDKAVLHDKLSGLEPCRQFGFGRVPNNPGPGKADQGLGLSYDDIPQVGIAGCHAGCGEWG